MQQVIVLQNQKGLAEKLAPFFVGEDISLMRIATDDLAHFLAQDELTLFLLDMTERENYGEKGIGLVHKIRRCCAYPIIAIGDASADLIEILNAGADDFVYADINPLELMARVKSRLRRYVQINAHRVRREVIYQVDGLQIDDSVHKVTVDNREVRLTPIEYRILRLLVRDRGKVYSNTQIYEGIWKEAPVGAENTVAVHIRHIRKKIEADPAQPQYLKVVWGMGYKIN